MALIEQLTPDEQRRLPSGAAVLAELEGDERAAYGRARSGAALMFMSVISLHELEHGVLLAERRDPAQGDVLRRWLDSSVATAFADRLLPVDERVARRAAALHVPDPAPFRDALIAATAQVHGMTVVTRNVDDFERFSGLEVTNPWA